MALLLYYDSPMAASSFATLLSLPQYEKSKPFKLSYFSASDSSARISYGLPICVDKYINLKGENNS